MLAPRAEGPSKAVYRPEEGLDPSGYFVGVVSRGGHQYQCAGSCVIATAGKVMFSWPVIISEKCLADIFPAIRSQFITLGGLPALMGESDPTPRAEHVPGRAVPTIAAVPDIDIG